MKSKTKIVLLSLILPGVLSSFYYIGWWIEREKLPHPFYFLVFFAVLFYIITQVYILWLIYVNADYPVKVSIKKVFTVDVLLPVYNEPVEMVEKSLRAVVNIKYPHITYLLDDGNKNLYRELAEKYHVIYLARSNNKHNKAGNINNSLKYSDGELIAVFDIDHIPQPDYLDRAIGYFEHSEIGAVQVALDHYNHSDSFVADAYSTMNDDFFAATMMGMNNMGCAVIFGSNSIFRRKALLSIGGYKNGLAEDLHTSLNLHAAGWKTAYVSELLAKGLVPADIESFFKQQLKWAKGVFDVLLKSYPPLMTSLKLKQSLCYLTRMTYYLAGPVVFAHLILTVIALFSESLTQEFSSYILHSLPFLLLFFLIQMYVKIFYFIKKNKSTAWLGGYSLVLASWPIYTFAFISAVLDIKIPYIPTPKVLSKKALIKLITPQIITSIILLSGIIYKLIYFNGYPSLITIAFAMILIIIHTGVFYGVWENIKIRRNMVDVKTFSLQIINQD